MVYPAPGDTADTIVEKSTSIDGLCDDPIVSRLIVKIAGYCPTITGDKKSNARSA